MAEKKVETQKKEVKVDAKIKVIAKAKSGSDCVLNAKMDGKDFTIIHGEQLELTAAQLQYLRIASSSWTYEPIEDNEGGK